MSESTRNIFPDHFGHTRNDICDGIKKIQPQKEVIEFNSHVLGKHLWNPNIEKHILQSVYKVSQ